MCDVCGKDLAVKYKKDPSKKYSIRQTVHTSFTFDFGPAPKGEVSDGEEKRIFGNYKNKEYHVCPECLLKALGIKPDNK